jgi:hypothetical protein
MVVSPPTQQQWLEPTNQMTKMSTEAVADTKPNKKKPPKMKAFKKKAALTIRDKVGNVVPKPWKQYTIYFRLEAIYIRQIENGVVDDDIKAELDLAPKYFDPIEHPRPAKYRDLLLPPFWYSSAQRLNAEKKRKHKKQDGRIGLQELNSMISSRWKTADDFTKAYVNELARHEAANYKERIDSLLESNKKPIGVDSDSDDEESEEAKDEDGRERVSPHLLHRGDSYARTIQPTPMLPRAGTGRNPELKSTSDRFYRENSYEWQERDHQQNYQGQEYTRSIPSSSINTTSESEYRFWHVQRSFQFHTGNASSSSARASSWTARAPSECHFQPPLAMTSLVSVPSWSQRDANSLMNALFQPEPEGDDNSDDDQKPASR